MTIKDPDNPLQLVILPLNLRGVTSLLYVRNVTIDEFNSHDHPRLHLTSETLTWDPSTALYEEQEASMIDYSGNIINNAAVRGPPQTLIINELHSLTNDMADVTHDYNFHRPLRKSAIQFATTQSENRLQWANLLSPTLRLMTTCLTS